MNRIPLAVLVLLICAGVWTHFCPAAYGQYQQATPAEEEVGAKPTPTFPEPRGQADRVVDVVAYVAALSLAAWILLKRRNRRWAIVLLVACLLYFGFYRSGCVCPIGSIQNVALSLADPAYTISIVVTVIFLLPVAVALFFGRVFCGAVCPFGAVQDLLLWLKLRVPMAVDKPLRYLRWGYLAAAIYFACGGVKLLGLDLTVSRDFIICRFDPFVGLFRMVNLRAAMAGDWGLVFDLIEPLWMWAVAGVVLVSAVFVGRPYCRWLCPYGAILGVCARAAKRGVTVMPDECCDCSLCGDSCPFGAVEHHAAVNAACLACARCYKACPLERQRLGLPVAEPEQPSVPAVPVPATPSPQRWPVTLHTMGGEQQQVELDYLEPLVQQVGTHESAALELLQTIQARHRYLPRPALQRLCALTGLTMSQLVGLGTFYNQFRLTPMGKHLICVCHGTACHVAGAKRITDAVRLHLGIAGQADTDPAGEFTVEEVACLGCCSLAPAMQIDGLTFGHLTSETACKAVDGVRAGRISPLAARPAAITSLRSFELIGSRKEPSQ